jgi:predicted DsbA family dithiol-disulfide isomerase
LRQNYEIDIQWRAFPLHPETPQEGLPLEKLFAGRNIDISQAMARLKKVAGELGLPLGDRKMTYNSRLAQELGKWAEGKGKGDDFHNAVFRSYFVDGKNIVRSEVLVELVGAVGLPEGEAGEILKTRAFRQAVDSDWALCEKMGISAVPTFVLDRQSLVGAQPYEALERLLLESGVKRK